MGMLGCAKLPWRHGGVHRPEGLKERAPAQRQTDTMGKEAAELAMSPAGGGGAGVYMAMAWARLSAATATRRAAACVNPALQTQERRASALLFLRPLQ